MMIISFEITNSDSVGVNYPEIKFQCDRNWLRKRVECFRNLSGAAQKFNQFTFLAPLNNLISFATGSKFSEPFFTKIFTKNEKLVHFFILSEKSRSSQSSWLNSFSFKEFKPTQII